MAVSRSEFTTTKPSKARVLLEAAEFHCPWCGEPNGIELEPGDAGQILVQDCAVCCRPIELTLSATDGQLIRVAREGD